MKTHQPSTDSKDYLCPKCESDLTVGFTQDVVTCPECGTVCNVNHDADFENGHWVDCTTLSIKDQ